MNRIKLILLAIIIISCKSVKDKAIQESSSVTKLETTEKQVSNKIKFEISPYGLIFTDVYLDNRKVKAMIDFGDPNVLQISSSMVKEMQLEVEATKSQAMDVNGNTFAINKGVISKLKVGNTTSDKVSFSSSPNEMESVSEQINTSFDAVIGWGYMKKYFITVNYSENEILLNKVEPTINNKKGILNYLNKSSYLLLPITINGTEIKAIIDTGAAVSVIDTKFKSGLKDSLKSVRLGEHLIIDEEFHEQDLSMLNLIDEDLKIILGGTFLKQYKVHINPIENKITLE